MNTNTMSAMRSTEEDATKVTDFRGEVLDDEEEGEGEDLRSSVTETTTTLTGAQILDKVFTTDAHDTDLTGLCYKARFANGVAWCDVSTPSVEDQIKLTQAQTDAQTKRQAVKSVTDSIAKATDPRVIAALTETLKTIMV